MSEAVHSDNIKSDEDVALDLQSIESKSAKACLLELYEDVLLDEHRLCCLLFHRYRPRYHYDTMTDDKQFCCSIFFGTCDILFRIL